MSDTGAVPLTRGQVPPAELPAPNALLTLAVGVVVIAALAIARDVLIPITLAVLLSFLLAPVVSALKKLRLPRVLAVITAVLMALAVILSVGTVIGLQVASLGPNLPDYEAGLQDKVGTVRHTAGGWLAGLQHSLEQEVQRAAPVPAAPRPAQRAAAGSAQNPLAVRVQPEPSTPLELAEQILTPVLAPLGTAALVLIITVFVMLQQEDLRDRMIRLFGATDLHRTTLALNDAARRLARYFLAQFMINAAFGAVITLGLFAIGVPSPALWGLLAMLMRFVPYVGVPIAAILPLLLAAATAPGWGRAAEAGALFFGCEALVGQVVEPLAYGRSTGLSPVSVVIAAIFWTRLWGPIGLLLSTPLTLCLVVLGRHVKRLEFLDVLLGDQPALTPVETLYQRLLADDADEAATQAEQQLRDRPLSEYYDDVVLQSLAMGTADIARGVLSRPRQLRMRDAICAVIEDLEDHQDALPAGEPEAAEPLLAETRPDPRRVAEGAPGIGVICVGGRTPLDDAAASMLAQLLRKHGFAARQEPHENVARDRIAAVDMSGVGVICVSYMEATGTPAHLRFLLRRLRARAPRARLILGLWAGATEVAQERDLRRVSGPDEVTGSLRETVSRCLDAAAASDEAVAVGG